MTNTRLERRWNACYTGPHADTQWLILQAMYRFPVPRAYHNLMHVEKCLDILDVMMHEHPEIETACRRCDIANVQLAIFFHDCVYDVTRTDNEVRSAEAARGMLGWADEIARKYIEAMILATQIVDHWPRSDIGKIVADIDLAAGLGGTQDEFDTNGSLIESEFTDVIPVETYRTGRVRFFENMLARDRIFYTDPFYDRYETIAATNMRNALKRMKA